MRQTPPRIACILLLLPIVLAASAWAAPPSQPMLDELVRTSRSAADDGAPDMATLQHTVQQLRTYGQSAVDALFAATPHDASAGWENTLDRVCGQRFCRHSRLFWHTDFAAAVAEAERTGRPILSLRLLGRLDEDRSCANSRFFRTVLYADPAVADELRARFVLHWSSERPVPKVSIDFGDGRHIEGTVTGNSVHYVLDSHGRLVDALPGLYGPGLFRQRIAQLAGLAGRLSGADDETFLASRRDHHQARLQLASWEGADPGSVFAQTASGAPSARRAARLATSKMASEIDVVEAIDARPEEITQASGRWLLLAQTRPADWRLSQASRDLLLSTHADYVRSVGGFSGLDEKATARRALADFEQSVGVDTMRNEFQLHAEVHRRLATANDRDRDAAPGIERFNRWVYDELFLTPASDPWLGLWSPEVIAALAPVADAR